MSAYFNGSNDLVFNFGNSNLIAAGSISNSIVAGWWRINSMVTGDYLWMSGVNEMYVRINSSGEIDVQIETGNTPEWLYRSTNAGLVVNKWYFLATTLEAAAGSVPEMATYLGTETTRPELLNFNVVVTGVGLYATNSGLTLCSGGAAGGHLDGYASQVFSYSGSANSAENLPNQRIYDRIIYPMWEGTFNPTTLFGPPNGEPTTSINDRVRWMPLDSATLVGSTSTFATTVIDKTVNPNQGMHYESTTTIGAPVYSPIEPGRRYLNNPISQGQLPCIMR